MRDRVRSSGRWMCPKWLPTALLPIMLVATCAGAEMRNAAYGNFYKLMRRGNLLEALMGQYALFNAEGAYLCEKYNIPEGEPDTTFALLLAIEGEVREGRGPIRLDLSRLRHALGVFIAKSSSRSVISGGTISNSAREGQ